MKVFLTNYRYQCKHCGQEIAKKTYAFMYYADLIGSGARKVYCASCAVKKMLDLIDTLREGKK